MRTAPHIACLLILSACAEWPDLPQSDATAQDWPTLRPLGSILPEESSDAETVADDLTARSASLARRTAGARDTGPDTARIDALNARAAVLRQPLEGDDGFEALRERISD